jgi:hypothetical protein
MKNNSIIVGLNLSQMTKTEVEVLVKCLINFTDWKYTVYPYELDTLTNKILTVYSSTGFDTDVTIQNFEDFTSICKETKRTILFDQYWDFIRFSSNDMKYYHYSK